MWEGPYYYITTTTTQYKILHKFMYDFFVWGLLHLSNITHHYLLNRTGTVYEPSIISIHYTSKPLLQKYQSDLSLSRSLPVCLCATQVEAVKMEITNRVWWVMVAAVSLIFSMVYSQSAAMAQSPAPAPLPASDGAAIDQGVACVLMLLALVLTYIIH